MSTGPWEGGKGSRPRKYNVSKYLDNYERIFGNATKARLQQEDDQPEHKTERAAGKPQDQAVAIAMSTAERAKKRRKKKATYE